MRGNRTTPANGAGNYDNASDLYPNQQTGFTRHTKPSSRRAAAPASNPVKEGMARLGSVVSSRRQGAQRQPRTRDEEPARPAPRASRSRGDNYFGTGDPCRVCGNPVDPTQSRCPHCGAFKRPLYQNVFFWVAIVVLVAAVVGLTLAINSCKSKEGAKEPAPVVQTGATEEENALNAALAAAHETLNAQGDDRKYTSLSLEGLQSAVDEASAASTDASATAAQLTAAKQKIDDATAALVALPDRQDYTWPGYDDLAVNVGNYVGTSVAVTGTVVTFTNDNGVTIIRLAVNGDMNCILLASFSDSLLAGGSVADGVTLSIYGTVSGTTQYQTDSGEMATVPFIVADYADLA